MKKTILLLLLFIIPLNFFAQKNQSELQKATQQIHSYGDIYFKLPVKNKASLKKLPKFISIDYYDIKKNYIKAYVSKKHFQDLLDLHLNFEILSKKKSNKSLTMANTLSQMSYWNRYPTYSVYVQMMKKFANDYPNLAVLDTIGYSQNNHLVLALKISDNPHIDENEPEFFYSAQMHGDELVGQILMLHLIDYLLTNYNSDSQVQNLVNNVEIWINPLANPDGLYNGNDNNVSNATRYLANYVDPNRNFPSPNSTHPDGEAYAQETTDMMNFISNHHFNLSANLHSGAEVANYPWDTWDSYTKTTADDNWWVHVCSEYANTVFNSSNNGYFQDVSSNGYIEGGDWYVIEGGRQDYITYFKQGREMTLELSVDKLLDAQLLPQHWNYNYHSLLNYINQSLYGLRGIITDADTGEPIEAKVEIPNHDRDNSFVFSDLPIGDYHRYLKAGNYNVTYSKTGYVSQTINVHITDNAETIQNVSLHKTVGIDRYSFDKNILVYPNPVKNKELKIKSNFNSDNLSVHLYNSLGREVMNFENINLPAGETKVIPVKNLISGVYFINLITKQYNYYKKIIIK